MQLSSAALVVGLCLLSASVARRVLYQGGREPAHETYAGHDMEMLEGDLGPDVLAHYSQMTKADLEAAHADLTETFNALHAEILNGLVESGMGIERSYAPGEPAFPIPRPAQTGSWLYSFDVDEDRGTIARGAMADATNALPLIQLRREILWLQRKLGIEEGEAVNKISPRVDSQ